MKNKNIIVLVLLATFLMGCSQVESHPSEKIELVETQSKTINTEIHSEHIKRTLADDLEIDADIFYPSNKEIATYLVERKIFSKDVINLFMDKEETEYTIENNPNYENSFTVTTKEGCRLSASEGYLFYVKSKEYDDVAAMIEECLLINDINETEELSFCNKAEAIALGEDKIKEFSENPVEVIRMVSMEHENLEKLQKDLLKEDSYLAGIENGKTNKIDEFTEDDDVYYIEYAIKQDDISLYSGIAEPQISMSIDAFWDFPVNVTVIIGNDGIRYFSYRNIFEKPMLEKKDENILSVDEALENVKKTYDNIILTEPINISKVWLEYIPVPNWQDLTQIELRPYWCIKMESVDENGEIWSKAERINALTGGNLTYGE